MTTMSDGGNDSVGWNEDAVIVGVGVVDEDVFDSRVEAVAAVASLAKEDYGDLDSAFSSSSLSSEDDVDQLHLMNSGAEATDFSVVFLTFLIVTSPLVLVALVSNLLALLVFYKKPMFRKILSNRLVINLIVINIVSCLFLLPSVAADLSTAEDPIRLNPEMNGTDTSAAAPVGPLFALCVWGTAFSSFVSNASILAVLAVGVDQYLAILYPLEYSANVTRLISWLLIGLVWGFGLLASVLGSLKLVSPFSPWTSCRVALRALEGDGGGGVCGFRWWLAGINAALYVVPLCLLSFIYLRIFFVARKNSRKIRRKNTSSVRMNAEALSGGYVEYDVDGDNNNPELEMSSFNGGIPNHRCSAAAGMRKASYEFSISFGSGSKGEDGGGGPPTRKGRKKKREVSAPSMSCPAAVLDETSLSQGNQLAPPQPQPPRAPRLKGAKKGHASLDTTVSCPAAVKRRQRKKPKPRYNKSLASASSKESSVDSSTCSLTPTPKRKCSFSSYSECRLVEEDEGSGAAKHQTFLFSIEAPSPPPTPVVGPEPADHLLSPGLIGAQQQPHLSVDQRRRRFSHASPLNATPSSSTLASRRSNCSSLRVDVPVEGGVGDELDEEEEEEAIRNRRVRRSASILSMTSQAARRLSVNVSRRASSVYHFFHAKEELRSAKIAALVLAVAFASWSPFVVLVSLPEQLSTLAAPWLHLSSCSLATVFAALSPYVYVFRSEKVKNCLGQLVSELASQCPCSKNRRRRCSKRIRSAGESVRTFVSRLGKNQSGVEVGSPVEEAAEEEGNGSAPMRHRSMSCPSLPCREEKRNVQVTAGLVAAAGPTKPLEEPGVTAPGISLSALGEEKKNQRSEMGTASASASAPPSLPPSRHVGRPPRPRRPLSANCAIAASASAGGPLGIAEEIIRQSAIPRSPVASLSSCSGMNGGSGTIMDRVALKNDI